MTIIHRKQLSILLVLSVSAGMLCKTCQAGFAASNVLVQHRHRNRLAFLPEQFVEEGEQTVAAFKQSQRRIVPQSPSTTTSPSSFTTTVPPQSSLSLPDTETTRMLTTHYLNHQVARAFSASKRYTLAARHAARMYNLQSLSEYLHLQSEEGRMRAVQTIEFCRKHDICLQEYKTILQDDVSSNSQEEEEEDEPQWSNSLQQFGQQLLGQEQYDVRATRAFLATAMAHQNAPLAAFLRERLATSLQAQERLEDILQNALLEATKDDTTSSSRQDSIVLANSNNYHP